MQHDELIWTSLSNHFCSFKVKTRTRTFCRNEYNATGLCCRAACPLANSKYATILERDGRCVLYIKSIERAHMPKYMWEQIKLPQNYAKALQTIDERLQYWPKLMVHRAKQRLTKITQYLVRMRRLRLRSKIRLVGINKKVEKRERGRERRALAAAKLDVSIEKELLERLRSGTYDGIFNYPRQEYDKLLGEERTVEDREEEEDDDEEEEGQSALDSDKEDDEYAAGDSEEESDEAEYEAMYADEEEEEEEQDEEQRASPRRAGDLEDAAGGGDGGDEFDFDDGVEIEEAVQKYNGDERRALNARMRQRRALAKARRGGAGGGGKRRAAARRRAEDEVRVEYEHEPTALANSEQEALAHN